MIADIKVLIQKASNISKKMQRLIYVNRYELEDALPLSFYDIFKSKNYCTLTLIVSDPISDRLSIKAGSVVYDEGNYHISINNLPTARPRRALTRSNLLSRERSNALYDDISSYQNVFSTLGKKPFQLIIDKNIRAWDFKRTKIITIYIVNSKMYKQIVGQFIPRPPLDEEKYKMEG